MDPTRPGGPRREQQTPTPPSDDPATPSGGQRSDESLRSDESERSDSSSGSDASSASSASSQTSPDSGRDQIDASLPLPIPPRLRPTLQIPRPEVRERRDSSGSLLGSSPGSFSAWSLLSWLTPVTSYGETPPHLEAAMQKLGINQFSSFYTDHDDTPSEAPLCDLSQAKAFLTGLQATIDNEADWNHLTELAATIQAIRPHSLTEVARALVYAPSKPDGLDTLILLQGLARLPKESRDAVAGTGLAVFSLLHPRDTAPFLEALRSVQPNKVSRFCEDVTHFALTPNSSSEHVATPLHKIDDYVEQARRTLAHVRAEPPARRTLDNLDVIRFLARIGPGVREAASDTAILLRACMRKQQLPLACTHLFLKTQHCANRWSQVAQDVRQMVQLPEEMYLNLADLNDTTHDNLILTLFQQGVAREPRDPPPPYEAADQAPDEAPPYDGNPDTKPTR